MTDKTADHDCTNYAKINCSCPEGVCNYVPSEEKLRLERQKTSSLEAENKRLKESILAGQEGLIQRLEDRIEDLEILLDAARIGIKQRDEQIERLEEQLKAADEVIKNSKAHSLFSKNVAYHKALEKYNTL